ncbi:hypothetical protein Tco_1309944 [Tanacetum coccineum]
MEGNPVLASCMFHSRSWVSGTVPEEIEWDYSKPSIGLGDDTLVSLGVFLGLGYFLFLESAPQASGTYDLDICTCLEAAVNSKKKREESAVEFHRYGYIKNHMKTVKNGQTRTRETEEHKRSQRFKAKARKSQPPVKLVKPWSTEVNPQKDKTPKVPFQFRLQCTSTHPWCYQNPTHPKAGDDEVNGGKGGVGGGDDDGGDDGDGGVAMMLIVAVRVAGVRMRSAGGSQKLAGGCRIWGGRKWGLGL